MTHSTVQVQFNSQVTDIPLTERQRLKDDHLSMSLRFFNLPLGITDGQQYTVQNLDQLYALVSSVHKTTRHGMTCTEINEYPEIPDHLKGGLTRGRFYFARK